jgi:hypothetical protein
MLKKMKRNILSMVSTAALMIGMWSCSENSDNANMAFDTYQGSSTYRLEGSAQELMQDSDLIYADSVSLILPLKLYDCDIATLRDSITSYALGVKGKPIAHAINTWLRESAKGQGFKAVEVNNDDYDVAQGYDFITGYVANLSTEMLVYCVRTESYEAGAAHGITLRRYINFWLEGKGSVITLEKIFTPQGLKKLPERIAEQAEAMSDIIGATSVSELPADGNFYISSEGEIVFSYQPYEIASFSQGTINIPFYAYELIDYMSEEGIAMFNLEDLED